MERLFNPGSRIIREAIVKNDIPLAIRLDNLWNTAIGIHGFQEGPTGQGSLHCFEVDNNIGLLLEDKIDKFKSTDLFVLSASAALHDIGRIRREHTGEDHGEEGKALLLDENVYREFLEDRGLATAIAQIVGVHDSGRIEELPEKPFVIRAPPGLLLRSLAAIFRIADMLDTDYRRCPYLLRRIKAMKFLEAPELWFGRGAIRGWDFEKERNVFFLQTFPIDKEEKKAVSKVVEALNDEITPSHRRLLENCPALYFDESMRVRDDTLHFPFRFESTETSGLVQRSADVTTLYSNTAKLYLTKLVLDLDFVNLDGLGEFKNKTPIKLAKVFIDVNAKLSEKWKPTDFDLFKEEIISYSEDKEDPSKPPKIIRDKRILPIISKMAKTSIPSSELIKSSHKGLKQIMILGDPGSGKSTIAQHFTSELARSQRGPVKIVPFWVIVREYVLRKSEKGASYTIEDFIEEKVNSHLPQKCSEGFVKYCLTNLESFVIFDAMDELLSINAREQIRREILSFNLRYDKVTCVVTSRVVGYEQAPLDPNRFLHVELSPLTPAQVTDFIRRWYLEREHDPNLLKDRTASLQKAIDDPDVGQLTKSPLLLTMMCLVHKAEADLPKQRALLYEKCANAFLVSRDKARDLLSYSEEQIWSCHEFLAYWMHTRGDETDEKNPATIAVNEIDLKEVLVDYLTKDSPLSFSLQEKKANEFLDVAKRRAGLIVERGPGLYAFGHRSFQEYLTARYLTSNCYGIEELWSTTCQRMLDSNWHEIVLLLAGRLGVINRRGLDLFVNKILKDLSPTEGLVLAGEIAADKTSLSDRLVYCIAEKLIHLLIETSDRNLWRKIVSILASLLLTDVRNHALSLLRETGGRAENSTKVFQIYMAVRENMDENSAELMRSFTKDSAIRVG